VAFIGSSLIENALSWFAPFLEKHSRIFEAFFTAAFGDSNREKVAETKMKILR
jgi:hypothetical protein